MLRHWVARWRPGHRPDPERGFALTRSFALAGALAIGLFSLGMGWLLGGFLETRMLVRDAALSRDFIQSIAHIQQARFGLPGTAPMQEFYAHVAAMPDVLRANVYAPDRRVLWSSQPALIGQVFPRNDELDRALAGEVVVHHDRQGHDAPKAEHQGLRAGSGGHVESYLPVFDPAGLQVLGVIEVYRQPAALFAAIQSGQRLAWAGSAAGGLFLFTVLVWFVRRTEGLLQAQQQRLVEAEALAMVGELSAAVAHSIRNPLVSIRTSAELQGEIHGDADGVNREIMRNVDRIEHLVRTLLTYASEPAERQASADLQAVLAEAAHRFSPDLRHQGKTLHLALDAPLGSVAADPVVLAQVFNSLLANAAEATAAGGSVWLSAQRRAGHPPGLTVSLRDDGAGMPPERLADIFKPFYTTKPRGLGLGLPLVRRIVQRLGGQVQVTSQPGQGTTVTLDLPRLPDAAPPRP